VSDKPVSDKPVSDKPVSDKPVSDKPVSDKPVSDKPVSDKPADDIISYHPPTTLNTHVDIATLDETGEYAKLLKLSDKNVRSQICCIQ
jgi:hypothetical protein